MEAGLAFARTATATTVVVIVPTTKSWRIELAAEARGLSGNTLRLSEMKICLSCLLSRPRIGLHRGGLSIETVGYIGARPIDTLRRVRKRPHLRDQTLKRSYSLTEGVEMAD
jgi:hypothetical protein